MKTEREAIVAEIERVVCQRLCDIKKAVTPTAGVLGDDAKAHLLEKFLWRDVLMHVSHSDSDLANAATLALGSSSIEFERWYE